MMVPVSTPIDLTNCDREPIHLLGAVQPFGFLIGVSRHSWGVVRASENEVVCLVFLNQTSSSSAVETPRITQSRLEMTMKRSGSSWLIASINAL